MKSLFEEMGGIYTQVGDYFIHDLKLSEKEMQSIGIWGQRYKRYLKGHKRPLVIYNPNTLKTFLPQEKLFFYF